MGLTCGKSGILNLVGDIHLAESILISSNKYFNRNNN